MPVEAGTPMLNHLIWAQGCRRRTLSPGNHHGRQLSKLLQQKVTLYFKKRFETTHDRTYFGKYSAYAYLVDMNLGLGP